MEESDHSAKGPTPLEIVLTTDFPHNLVLHWGALAPSKGRAWHSPPPTIIPPNSEKSGELAVETEFSGLTVESAFAPEEVREARVPLQRVVIPVGLDVVTREGVSGIAFVLRSADGSRWYRDGQRDFSVPLPGVGT